MGQTISVKVTKLPSRRSGKKLWKKNPYIIRADRLPPLPAAFINSASPAWKFRNGLPTFVGSKKLFRQYAWLGDAVLERVLPEVLQERYGLASLPIGTSQRLVRNAVLSHLAVSYKLRKGKCAVAEVDQHTAADAFEAFVAAVEPTLLRRWLRKVFRRRVYPHLRGEVRRLRADKTVPLCFSKGSKRYELLRKRMSQEKVVQDLLKLHYRAQTIYSDSDGDAQHRL